MVMAELRAGAAVLSERADQGRRIPRLARDVLAIPGHDGHPLRIGKENTDYG
jgi:hypothetical protein